MGTELNHNVSLRCCLSSLANPSRSNKPEAKNRADTSITRISSDITDNISGDFRSFEETKAYSGKDLPFKTKQRRLLLRNQIMKLITLPAILQDLSLQRRSTYQTKNLSYIKC